MTDDERQAQREADRKERNRDKLDDDAMMTHMMFMAAAMAGGEKPAVAAKSADQAIAELKKRFL